MRIQAVEAQVGITKKNIRFYEQEGLLTPSRNSENHYRDYSEEDVLVLKRIRLLRRLGVPLDEIRRMQAGTITVRDAMIRHRITLDREIRNLQLSGDLCGLLADQDVPLSQLEPQSFLDKIDELEQKGARFMNHKKTDFRQKMVAPIVAALVMVLIMAGAIGILLWAQSVEPMPLPILLFILLFPLAVCVGVFLALWSRWKEVQKGEADDADQY